VGLLTFVCLVVISQGSFPYVYADTGYVYYAAIQETGLYGDEDGIWITLPFSFQYDNNTFDSIFVTTNGYITFSSNIVAPYPQNFPDPTLPNGIIAPLWKDFVVYSGGRVKTALYGYSPYRYFVIEWDSIYLYGGNPGHRYKFEVILFENGGDGDSLVFSYYMIPANDSGWQAVCGLESLDGEGGVVYCYDGSPNPIFSGKSVIFHRAQVEDDCGSLIILEPSSTRGTGEELVPLGAVMNYTSIPRGRFVHLDIRSFSNELLYHDSLLVTIPADSFSFVSFSPFVFPDAPCSLKLELYLSSPDDYPLNDTVIDTTVVIENCDTFAYYILRDIGTCNFIDISTDYDTIIIPGMDGGGRIVIPFEFPYYDTVYTSLYAGINGGISLSEDTVDYYNYPLSGMGSEDFIAVFWEDWAGSSDSSARDSVIFVKSFGSDSIVLMWRGIKRQFYSAGPIDFEVVLYPSGNIKMLYDISMNYWYEAYDVTIGLHSRNGDYVQYTFNEDPWVPDWWYPHGIYFERYTSSVDEEKILALSNIELKPGINYLYYNIPCGSAELEIYDATGRKIKQGYILRSKGLLPFTNFHPGVYFAVLKANEKTIRKKVVVIR